MLLVLLPITCIVAAALWRFRSGSDPRSSFLAGLLAAGLLTVGIAETSSLLGAFARLPVAVAWLASIVLFAVLALRAGARPGPRPPATAAESGVSTLATSSRILLAGLGAILAVTLVTAVAAAPNNADSMIYHLPRAEHWVQNGSVDHFSTHILRQVQMPPFAEITIAHLHLLAGSDRADNLVQWLAFLGCLAAASLLARDLGASVLGQLLAAVFAATAPMAMLQASSTKNDLVASLWLILFAWQLLRLARGRSRGPMAAIAAGGALGLALLTKGTVYLYALPLAVGAALFDLYRSRTRRPLSWALRWTLVLLVALVVNAGHYARNASLFGSPLGPGREGEGYSASYTVDRWGPGVWASNLVRNLALQTATPWTALNEPQDRALRALHEWVGLSVDDPATTWPGTRFRMLALSRHEDQAAAPHHLVLAAVALGFAIATRRRFTAATLWVALSVLAGFLAFSLVLKWQPWHARLHLPLFVLAAPVVGVGLGRFRRAAPWIGGLLLVVSVFWLDNPVRPLLGERSVLRTPRWNQYFSQRGGADSYLGAVEAAAASDCRTLGLLLSPIAWEYPLWTRLRATEPPRRIVHASVDGATAALAPGDERLPPCLLAIDGPGTETFARWSWRDRYQDGWTVDDRPATMILRTSRPQSRWRARLELALPDDGAAGNARDRRPLTVAVAIGDGAQQTAFVEPLSPRRVTVEGEADESGVLRVRVRAERGFRPVDLGASGDDRRLGVRVQLLDLEPGRS